MPRIRLRHVVARRQYQLVSSHENDAKFLSIAFSKPVRVRGSADYVCFYEISGGSKAGLRRAVGVDSIQALVLAFTNAATMLYTSEEYKAGRLTHRTDENLGLPTFASLSDLVRGEKTSAFL